MISSVLRPCGAASESDEEAAHLLHSYWSGVARSRDVQHARFSSFLPFVQKLPERNWTISYEDFVILLAARRNTAPGPDGFPISVWKAGGDHAARLLYRSYSSILASGRCPPDFCESLSAFIPKGQDSNGEASAAPEDLRPICLSNADAKLIIAAIVMPLEESARLLLHPSQACSKGRHMVDNIWQLEAHWDRVVGLQTVGYREWLPLDRFRCGIPVHGSQLVVLRA